jgi:PAS domain S-box-containing protein
VAIAVPARRPQPGAAVGPLRREGALSEFRAEAKPHEVSRLLAENARLRREVARLKARESRSLEQARADLRASEAQYAGFFDHSPIDLFVLGVRDDGRFVFEEINPMLTRSTGYTREMLVGKSPEEALTPKNAGFLTAMYRKCIESGERVEYEVGGTAPIGEVIRRTILVPIAGEDGLVRKILGTSIDLTQMRRIEAALRQAQKIEAVGRLTGGIAHDFNNLLTAVIGSLELLHGRTLDENARILVERALQAAERGAMLTGQLLAFSRHQRLDATALDLNDLVAASVGMLRSTLGGTIRIEMALDPKLWPVLADRNQLELVLLNLAINARDAMPEGGTITIATGIETTGTPERPEHPPAGEWAVVAMSDTGSGMAPEILDRAFEPFFTTKPAGRGSGLGLSQALGVLQQSGGGVRIDTALGRGTRVRIYLPRADRPPAQERRREAAVLPETGRLRVLLADDDAASRSATVAMLQSLGHQVVPQENGAAALGVLERDADVDLMIVDYAMPGMNGAELASRVHEANPAMPILFITGNAGPAGQTAMDRHGPVLQKPFRIADLAGRMRQCRG